MEKNGRPKSFREIGVICFTGNGEELCRKIVAGLGKDGLVVRGYRKGGGPGGAVVEGPGLEEITRVFEPLKDWTGRQFRQSEGLIFIGAVGIAVRAVSSWIKDKFLDPAVVVVDEKGQFAIPILSGHVGGANDLAREIGQVIGALPVITTATDVQGVFAVDEFARERGLWISDRGLAKEVSAALLAGEKVGFFSDFPLEGNIPRGCVLNQRCRRNMVITTRKPEEEGSLCLVPRVVTLGIGCRKGIPAKQLGEGVFRFLEKNRIFFQAVFQAASINLKEEEEGLHRFCRQMGWNLQFFPAEELKRLPGGFSHSDFVDRITGVGNVCERAAVMGSGGGFPQLIQKKEQFDGVTVAAALSDWKVIM